LLASNVERHSTIGEIIHAAREKSIPFEYVPRQVLDRESDTGAHQGVLAFTAVKEYVELDDLLAISKEKNEPPLYCILDGIEDPQNLGSILRSADAAGFHGVVIRERRAAGLTSAVARASAGAVEYVAVARVTNISDAILELKKQNVWVVGIDQSGQEAYTKADYKSATAIVIGAEGKGIAELVRKRCDILASIPMQGRIASLNASVAAALVMYEARRVRETTPVQTRSNGDKLPDTVSR
jgi:23S rRNA (guanosine2251-2'-O)-methyltransferase